MTGKTTTVDLLVIGSGAGGMSAAVTARHAGLDVLVVEREAHLGGTAALSGGWLYVPGDPHSTASDPDTREEQLAYLRDLAGDRLNSDRVDGFLDAVPEMIRFFEGETFVRFVHPDRSPDYEMNRPGTKVGGRSVYAEPVDGLELGEYRMTLSPYLAEFTFFGLMPQIGPDLMHFLNANKSLKSMLYVTRRLIRQKYEELRYGRGLSLSNGNALMARMVREAADVGVDMRTNSRARELTVHEGRVTGATIATPDGLLHVEASRGVVLACGGISHDRVTRRALFRHAPTGDEHHSAMSASHDGDARRLAEPVGAVFESDTVEPAAWVPVSVFRGRGGRTRVFPHLRGMGLPGIITVDRHGRRFANESDSYHVFGPAMVAANEGEADVKAFMIADATAMRNYGLGFAKPWPIPRIGYRRSGYLYEDKTLEGLARKIGVDPQGLRQTVDEFNGPAERGEDPAFNRGTTAFNRFKGDVAQEPNPSLAPLSKGPYFATIITMGDIGSFAGLDVDGRARVKSADGAPIPGLYAVGTAAVSPFAGTYPGAGGNLGPAVTFGFVAARDAAGADASPVAAAGVTDQAQRESVAVDGARARTDRGSSR